MLNENNFFGDSIKIKSSVFDGQSKHICPVCSYNYIHFEKVFLADYDNSKSGGIAIKFNCEAGHKFFILIENYKGNGHMIYTDEKFKVIKSVVPEMSGNSVFGENNVQTINSGSNSQVNVNSTDMSDEMSKNLLKKFNELSFDEKIDVFNYLRNKK